VFADAFHLDEGKRFRQGSSRPAYQVSVQQESGKRRRHLPGSKARILDALQLDVDGLAIGRAN
jgi:hypothetical protein